MKIKLLKDGLVEPYSWPGKTGDIFDINPRDVQTNIDSGLAELHRERQTITPDTDDLSADDPTDEETAGPRSITGPEDSESDSIG